MNIFTKKTINVFNPELVGQAVVLKFGEVKQAVVITAAVDAIITTAGVHGLKTYNLSQFDKGEVSMEFLQVESEVQEDPEVVTFKPKYVRNNKQIENENMYLTTILLNHGGEMHLSQIIERMVAAGYPHWATSNASAHIATAQRWGKPIARVRKGYFKYVGEVL